MVKLHSQSTNTTLQIYSYRFIFCFYVVPSRYIFPNLLLTGHRLLPNTFLSGYNNKDCQYFVVANTPVCLPLLPAACKDQRKALEVSQHSEEMGLILGVCAGGLVVLILLLGAVIIIIKKG